MTTNNSALQRLKTELDDIKKKPPVRMSVGPVGDDLFKWEGVLYGPADSPYEEGLFKFIVKFPPDYPMHPPSVLFTTKVFHPNVATHLKGGGYYICIDILQHNWTSIYTISQVMLSISSLLTDPNPNSPMNPESAQLYTRDRKKFNQIVRQWVKQYASPESLN